MRAIWQDITQSGSAVLKGAAAVAAVCVLGTLIVAGQALSSAAVLQTAIDRDFALDAAQKRLVTGLIDRSEGRGASRVEDTLQALLLQPEYGFRYLAVRDAEGSMLAAHGRYESLNRNTSLSPALRRWLRATLYTAMGETGQLTLREGDRTVGSVEYAIGSARARLVRDAAVDRLRTTGWVAGLLALLFGGATVLLLRSAMAATPTARVAGERSKAPLAGGAPRLAPKVAEPAGTDPLPAALDTVQLGLIDVDHDLRVRGLNDTAAALTGWRAQDAIGQLVYTVFHARDDVGAPIISPAERCVREGTVQAAVELRLRPRGGSGQDSMVEARALPLAGLNGGARMLFHDVSVRLAQRLELHTQARVAEGVIDHLLEAVLTTDAAGVLKSANTRALRMFGYSSEEMLRMTVARLLPVPFMNTPGLKLTDYMPGGAARMPKLAGWRKDATTFPAELVVEPMRVGGEDRLVVIIRDITEQMRSQSLAQRLGRLLDSASEEVYIFDAQSLYFIEVNRGARKNLGLKPDQLARMSLASIATDLEPALLQSYLARLRGGDAEHVTYKTSHRRSDGSTYPVEVRLSFSRDEEPPVFMAIALDITEREAAEKRMRQLAHYDALTSLPNRTLLFDRLKQAMLVAARAERQLAILFMDLDGFKPVNDQYGHEAGDAVLQAVAHRLNAGLRAADTVSRFGGDEFVVLAHSIRDAEDALMLASKIHEVFKAPFEIRGEKVSLSTSIGVALYPYDNVDAEGLLRHADAAMYEAKQLGPARSQIYTLPGAEAAAIKPRPQRVDLAREIHAGLATHQFNVQFLPVITASGEVAAAVVDFFWMHPEFGRVDSRDTLLAARRAGLNAEIEQWMLQECAAQYRLGQQQGLPALPVLLPLTGRQWRDPEFAERLRSTLQSVAAPMKLLIPLIDGSDWQDAAGAVQMLWSQLFQQGLRIAVRAPDPAGTFDGISFVLLPLRGTGPAEENEALATLRRYQALEPLLLLENIASATQWDLLRKAGARLACGSGLQGALTPLEFAVWCSGRESKAI